MNLGKVTAPRDESFHKRREVDYPQPSPSLRPEKGTGSQTRRWWVDLGVGLKYSRVALEKGQRIAVLSPFRR